MSGSRLIFEKFVTSVKSLQWRANDILDSQEWAGSPKGDDEDMDEAVDGGDGAGGWTDDMEGKFETVYKRAKEAAESIRKDPNVSDAMAVKVEEFVNNLKTQKSNIEQTYATQEERYEALVDAMEGDLQELRKMSMEQAEQVHEGASKEFRSRSAKAAGQSRAEAKAQQILQKLKADYERKAAYHEEKARFYKKSVEKINEYLRKIKRY